MVKKTKKQKKEKQRSIKLYTDTEDRETRAPPSTLE